MSAELDFSNPHQMWEMRVRSSHPVLRQAEYETERVVRFDVPTIDNMSMLVTTRYHIII